MEIHAPDKPILTPKEAAVHLAIVTAGILIALSLESVVEYVHHKTVVREARAIMEDEIEANQKDLDETIKRIALMRSDLEKGIKMFSAMSRGEKPVLETLPFMLKYRTAQLHSAAHATAQLMGAFAYMDYREVSRYASVYDEQDRFLEAQAAALKDGTAAFAWFQGRDIHTAPDIDLIALTERLRQTDAGLTVAGQFAAGLQRRYEQFLIGK